MLSESHGTLSTANWFGRWVKNGGEIPKITVTDHFLALMGGICRAFNRIYLRDYMSLCFQITHGAQQNTVPPKCFIRIDYAHVVKNLCNFDSLRKKSKI